MRDKPSPAAAFRSELEKIMPGYKWTVHQASNDHRLDATGTQSSGFNRLSTLVVTRSVKDGAATYEARSAGNGTRSPWLATNADTTLARALRGLQQIYEYEANRYRAHACDLERGRKAKDIAHA